MEFYGEVYDFYAGCVELYSTIGVVPDDLPGEANSGIPLVNEPDSCLMFFDLGLKFGNPKTLIINYPSPPSPKSYSGYVFKLYLKT